MHTIAVGMDASEKANSDIEFDFASLVKYGFVFKDEHNVSYRGAVETFNG
jgi:hypothetical protein